MSARGEPPTGAVASDPREIALEHPTPVAPKRMGFSRLAVRIYVAGIAQMVIVAATFALLHDAILHMPWKSGGKHVSTYILSELARNLEDPDELKASFARVDERLGSAIAFYRADGRLLAANSTQPPPFPTAEQRKRLADSEAPVRLPDFTSYVNLHGEGGAAYGVMKLPGPPWSLLQFQQNLLLTGLALLALALTSWVLARSLARPMQRLAHLARVFGSGDLSVRANLKRRDELGEVAGAFDEMAGRIAQLVRAQKELLANVSHELRTPLSRIRVALDIAEEGNEREAREVLSGISEDLSELQRLLDDVLTTARLDLAGGRAGEGTLPLRAETVTTNELLDKATARFHGTHPKHRLIEERDANLPLLFADAQLLRRALDNLLDNAGKYSSGGSQVRLRTWVRDDEVHIEVQDEGRGIAPSDLPNLFTPFFRADRSRTRATGGVGLGLTLARRILQAHGGTLEVESTLGKGTIARMHLPVMTAGKIAPRRGLLAS